MCLNMLLNALENGSYLTFYIVHFLKNEQNFHTELYKYVYIYTYTL
jgi:uncharacterized protein Veg